MSTRFVVQCVCVSSKGSNLELVLYIRTKVLEKEIKN